MRDKIRRFCHEYIIDSNGKQSAIRAGYAVISAEVRACEMLKTDDVRKYIKHLQDVQDKRLEISADKVLEQYRRLAFSDINDYYYYQYQLRFITITTEQEKRKRARLEKYLGVLINESKYNDLPQHYKYFYTSYKVLKPFEELTVEQRASIQSVTYDKHGNAILKLSDREKSLDALAKHLGIFEKDNHQKATKVNVEQRTLNDFYGDNNKAITEVTPLTMKQH